MRKASACALILASLGLSTGCAKTPSYALIAVDQLCQDWRHKTIAKADALTERTAAQIEADNKSRPNWGCKYGENVAQK